MPFNEIKKYNELLELNHYSYEQKIELLQRIFDRDIVNNKNFKFRKKAIHPTKNVDGSLALDTLFKHLTFKSTEINEEGLSYKSRDSFDIKRSERLHWIWYHVQEKGKTKIFSVEDRVKGKTKIRTYIFDEDEKYVIVLEPYRKCFEYYLLSAYYLDEEYGIKNIKKKYQKKLDMVY